MIFMPKPYNEVAVMASEPTLNRGLGRVQMPAGEYPFADSRRAQFTQAQLSTTDTSARSAVRVQLSRSGHKLFSGSHLAWRFSEPSMECVRELPGHGHMPVAQCRQ